ncbi:DUF3987 domain-containing protein [Synechococcus sp. C9]|uniref:DUF3987 domain-containing protein n=2 Tax=Synechococcus sp. C9 TaxID=102119 RepID=UPI001FF312D5|nr:DUF3987 domain-containing protein [Synechococcus sp. C9]
MTSLTHANNAVHHLDNRHRQEWLQSAVSPDVIDLNVETLRDAQAVAKLLNLPLDGLHGWGAKDLTPGWIAWSVDPLTGKRDGSFIYKPDKAPLALDDGKPKIGTDGTIKRCKYIQRRGAATKPLFLQADWLNWPEILADESYDLALCEGGKKAGSLISQSIAAISIQGMWNSQVNWELKPELRIFCPGRNIYLFPDADWRTNANVAQGWLRTGALLQDAGANIKVCVWDSALGKGVDDALANGAILEKIMGKALDLSQWAKQVKTIKTEAPEVTPELVNQVLAESQARFDVYQLIPTELANAITRKAKTFELPPETLLSVFLAVASSLIPHKLSLGDDYTIPAILWLGLMGDSGTGKSPVINTFTKPLSKFQREAYERYESAMEAYRQALGDKEIENKPSPPNRRFYYLQDFTWEAISTALKARNHCLIYSDELAGFVLGQNQYKQRGGNDRQRWLTAYDGGAIDVLRTTRNLHIPDASLSVLGGIQPSILQQLIGRDGSTVDGFWARFLWIEIPSRKLPCPIDAPVVNLSELLAGVYERLDQRAGVSSTFSLCPRGKRLWAQWWDEVEALKDSEVNPFLKAIYPKMMERAGRVALVAHCVNSAFRNDCPGEVIPPETLEWAIAFIRWTLQQSRLVYADCGHCESPEAQRIARFIQKFQGKTVDGRRVNAWWTGNKKPLAKECRQWLADLVALGYAEVISGTPDKPDFAVRILGAKVHNPQKSHYDGDTSAPTPGAFLGAKVHLPNPDTKNAPNAPVDAPTTGAPETTTGSQFQGNAPNAPDFIDSNSEGDEQWEDF